MTDTIRKQILAMPSVAVVAWQQGLTSLLRKKQALRSFSEISSVTFGKAVR